MRWKRMLQRFPIRGNADDPDASHLLLCLSMKNCSDTNPCADASQELLPGFFCDPQVPVRSRKHQETLETFWKKVVYATLSEASRDYNRIPMTILASMDEHGKPITPADLADHLHVSVSAVAQQVNRLSYQGFVERTDVRYHHGHLRPFYQPTDKGRRFLAERLDHIIREVQS